MSSKKYLRDPRYHKLRDISRQSTSAHSRVRKQFRKRKAHGHRSLRKLAHMKLREASKNYQVNNLICDDDKCDLTPIFTELKKWNDYTDLKRDRWVYDALNHCLRWANGISASVSDLKLRQLFRTIESVSTAHLKFHIFDIHANNPIWPSRTRQSLAREFSGRGLRPTSNPHRQLIEIAQQASINQTETLLNAWVANLTDAFYYQNKRIWLWPVRGGNWRTPPQCWQDETYIRKTKKGLVVGSSWRIHNQDTSVLTICFRLKKAKIGYLSYGGHSGWHLYLFDEHLTVTESEMSVRQLGRAINKKKWLISDHLRKRTFQIDISKNVKDDSPFPWTISVTKGLTLDLSCSFIDKIWRPLNGFEDSEAWATDIYEFLQFFHDRKLFESAYWRWEVCELLTAVTPNLIR